MKLLHLWRGYELSEINFEFEWKQPSTKMSSEISFFRKFVDKILQKHLLCINNELLLCISRIGFTYKTPKVQNHSVSAYWLFRQMIGPLKVDLFTAAMFIFFLWDSYICASLEQHSISSEGLSHLEWHFVEVDQHAYWAGLGWWMQAGSVPWDQKFYYKWNFQFSRLFHQTDCLFTRAACAI